MKFLIDNPISPAVALALAQTGHDAVHVRDCAMQSASDQEIFDRAAAENRIVVSADTDFATLLAERKARSPSVVLFRHGSQHRPSDQITLLNANLPGLTQDLETGSIVVIEPGRLRIRSLPLIP